MSHKPLLGFNLALLATATWGGLPIAAQKAISVIDAQTLVWFRFIVAAAGLILILGFAKKLPKLTAFTPKILLLIILGVIGLSLYFFGSSYALHFISPTTSQVLWQLSPFTMMLCSVVIFKEQFAAHQKIGLVLLLVGLVAFFNDRLGEILQLNAYAIGVLIGAISSMVWVAYGIAQKLLSANFNSQQILLMIYIGCGLVMTPFASPTQVNEMNGWVLGCFIFCCLNTLIAYGAYAEALNHWQASKVSVVTVLIPIFTMLFSHLAYWLYPDVFEPLEMNLLSYIGAIIVIFGAMYSIIGQKLIKKNK
ncbi:DMT family transporter [Ursidibacter arcticus]